MNNRKMLQNAKWIVVCKIIQSLIQLAVGMLSARYLGPSNYGLISYAASVVAFAVPVMQLGVADTLVKEYVSNPEKNGEILGTVLGMNLMSGLACIVGVSAFAAVMNPGEPETILVCGLYSLSLIFQSLELVKYWFLAGLRSKYSSVAMLCAHVVVSGYKVYLLATGKSVYWFALTHSVEYCAAGVILLVLYARVGGQSLRFSWKRAADIFSRSKYYILASLMVTVFQNTDHVMLKMIAGDAENGFYTTAVTCTSVVCFVYTAIIDSARPGILESRESDPAACDGHVTRLYSVIIWLSLAQSLAFTLLAKPMVYLLYGEAYLPAVPVLRVITWQTAFSYMGTVRNVWILAEEKHSLLWRINLAGVCANVALNALTIPVWGACGAAAASVLTQIITNLIVGFFMKPIRQNNRLLVAGLDPRWMIKLIFSKKRTNS